MPNRLTPEKMAYLKLPITISEAAWLQAIYINDFLYLEVNKRLNFLLESTYREILNQAASFSARHIDYGLYRFEPHGKRDEHVWLSLRLHIVYTNETPVLLRVTLPDESLPA